MSAFRMASTATRRPSAMRRAAIHLQNPRVCEVYCGSRAHMVEVSTTRGVTCKGCLRAVRGPSGRATHKWATGG